MSTMIAVHYSSGKRRCCNASCYNGRRTACHCVCGGMNHAKGQQQATQNTRELSQGWLDEARRIAGDTEAYAKIPAAVAQYPLPAGV